MMNVIPEHVPLHPIKIPGMQIEDGRSFHAVRKTGPDGFADPMQGLSLFASEDLDWKTISQTCLERQEQKLNRVERLSTTPKYFPASPQLFPAAPPQIPSFPMPQEHDFLCILDTDAISIPCSSIWEFIEISVLLLDTSNMEFFGPYHSIVKPRFTQTVSSDVSRASGIQEWQLKCGKDIVSVMQELESFVREHIPPHKTFTFVTLGNTDLGNILPTESKAKNFTIPPFLQSWVDLREVFTKYYGNTLFPAGISMMMNILGLKNEDSLHSTMNDVKVLGRICERMIMDGAMFLPEQEPFPQ